jgi:cytochrome c oxidase cbb3-type subunit 2
VGGRYSDEWHRVHLNNPRDVVPESNMPAFVWLTKGTVDPAEVAAKMRVLRKIGVPYTDADIQSAAELVSGHSELDALIAYLQGLKFHGESDQ